ncbi:hypothetical protein VTN77DRAFT_8482 [Rasamsonia byssochlamydoides]|uniref:uncharacterized protein n=1 Tax=Rasamsonia byssochlamydoides TaxID=89139 RepID=UPI0037444AD4
MATGEPLPSDIWRFITDFPDGTIIYHYGSSIKKLEAVIRTLKSDARLMHAIYHLLIVRDLPLDFFQVEHGSGKYSDLSEKILENTRPAYFYDDGLFVVNVFPIRPHKYIAQEFEKKIHDWCKRLEIPPNEYRYFCPRFQEARDEDGRPTSARQCQGMFIPPRQPSQQTPDNEWPSFVVEVATAAPATEQYLHFGVNWWFRESKGIVKAVLLLFVDRQEPRSLTIEKWVCQPEDETDDETDEEPATPTLANAEGGYHAAAQQQQPQPPSDPVPRCVQKVVVTDEQVTGAPLLLEFEYAFERPPQMISEINLRLDEGFLQRLMKKFNPR